MTNTQMAVVAGTVAGAGALAPAPEKILRLHQAAAYYSAMCLVHCSGGLLAIHVPDERLHVRELPNGRVNIFTYGDELSLLREEDYPTFVDFAAAYGVRV